jgi:formate dehydrogenase accessory protein FdhE
MPTPIITDGTMDRMVKAPKVILPVGAGLFQDRANRFDALASSDDTGAYMRFLAHVCRGQCKAYEARAAQRVSERAVSNSREHGMPPLSAHVFPRDAAWRSDLLDIVKHVKAALAGTNPQAALVMDSIESDCQSNPTACEAIG